MKIVFMGTPEFALVSLNAIVNEGHAGRHKLIAVVTQPDRPAGRGGKLAASPVKLRAQELGLPCLQPEKLKATEAVKLLEKYPADLFVVAAYGQILSRQILDMPVFGCINVHASLLPKYRGAAPIQRAIIEGETKTGVTIMQMNEGLDTGDMLLSKQIEIQPCDNSGTIHDKLARLGAEALIEVLDLIEDGRIVAIPQEEALASYAKMITKQTGRINWDAPAADTVNLIRGLAPSPCAWTKLSGETYKIYSALVCDLNAGESAAPGQVLASCQHHGIQIAARGGIVRVLEIQRQNGKRLTAEEFLRGNSLSLGSVFGGSNE